MLPELGTSFGVSAGTASLSVAAYLLPFAAVMLVSGTLGERWGRRRTVTAAYALYVLASLARVFATTMPLFLAARAVQGVANAFSPRRCCWPHWPRPRPRDGWVVRWAGSDRCRRWGRRRRR
jgi:MFS family permease